MSYTTDKRMRRAIRLGLVVGLLLSASGPAHANDPKDGGGPSPDPPSQGNVADDAGKLARSWFAEGVQAEKAGLVDKACEAFGAAMRFRRAPQVAGKLVPCEVRAGRKWAAADLALYALTDEGAPAAERARLEGTLADLRREVGWVRIVVDRPGADVFITGRHVGRSPFPRVLHVRPGTAEITAEILDNGKHETRVVVEIHAGQEASVTLRLREPEPAAVAPAATPATAPVPATPDGHGGSSVRRVGLTAGATLAATAAVAGGVLFILHAQALDDADGFSEEVDRTTGRCPVEGKTGPCRGLYDALVRSDDFGNAGIGAFVGAGVLGAATLGWWLATDPEPPKSSAFSVTPLAGRDVAGVVVSGRIP